MKRIIMQALMLLSVVVAVAQEDKEGQTEELVNVSDTTNTTQILDDVVVTAQRQLVRVTADKTIYDVQGDAESKTKTVMEMLRKVPLVTVDGEENVKVKGSSNFKIYKNGHPDPSFSSNPKEVLKTVPAAMVKRIEVITEPGAKYDAEGTAAILNIVMVDGAQMNGLSGTVSAHLSDLGFAGGNGYLISQIGKLVLSVNYGYNYMSHRQTDTRYENETVYKQSGMYSKTGNTHDNPGNVHFGQLEASYEIDSLNLLSASFGGYRYDIDVAGTGYLSMAAADGSPLYSYDIRYGIPTYSYQDWNGRVDYQHKTCRPDEVFTFSYMFATTNNRTNQVNSFFNMQQAPFNYDGYTQRNHERFYEHTLQADWVRPIAKYHKIEAGMKYIYRLNKSQTAMEYNLIGVQPVDNGMNGVVSPFRHTTQVGAAYVQYIYTYNRWSARGGLRYEWSRMKAKEIASSGMGGNAHWGTILNDWVPSVTINYKVTDANSLKMSFSTSISRPGINYLNPTVIETPTSISYGNAQLSSGRFYSVELTYMHIGRKFTYNISPSYRWATNQISVVNSAQGDKTVTTYDNVLRTRNYDVAGYMQWSPVNGTQLVVNANGGRQQMKNPSLGLSMASWSGNVFAQVTQKLPWKVMLTLGGGGAIGHSVASVYGYSGSYHWTYAGLHRSFFKGERLTVRLWMQDPFEGKYRSWYSRTVQGEYTGYSKGWNRSRQFGIAFTWRFGKHNVSVKKANTTIENSDVVGGIKKDNAASQQ